jgi:hypothetical protein
MKSASAEQTTAKDADLFCEAGIYHPELDFALSGGSAANEEGKFS